ncbi:hypothetical protein RUM43_001254 [Polyplax serrata]|uniref:Fatty acyl-CoA reductase n=1 Tax=Polyplax serrata TaxID=468196 RepID=A0AAN8XPF6_POLSC
MSRKFKRSRRDDRIPIPEYFSGKSVFITGGTGFMGKVLIEKLLRSCSGIERIYVLMRGKKNKTVEERLQKMLALPAFVKVRRKDDTLLNKVVPLTGDASEKNLGLSEEDQKTLFREVSVIYHVAASVRFDDPLKDALLMNTRGTYEILKLASQMKYLDCFLYVSTTYCNTHKEVIEEIVYPPPGDWRKLLRLGETLDAHTLDIYAPKILGQFPNTYTFTKALAEQACNDFKDTLPIVIFRPSIVIASIIEPLPGWVDNFNGPVGLLVASGKGIIRTIYGNPKISSDYIPVDLAIKAMIVASWNRAISRESPMGVEVFNASSYAIKNITQEKLTSIAHHATVEVPLNDIIWYPTASTTQCKFVYYTCVILLHILPALIIDSALKLAKKKPILMKLQRRIFHANYALTYFITKQWSFKNERMFSLADKILEEDTEDFFYKLTDIDDLEYFITASYGAREYLLHEDNIGLPEAKKHQRKMYWVHKATNFTVLVFMIYVAVKLNAIPFTRNILITIMNYFIRAFA